MGLNCVLYVQIHAKTEIILKKPKFSVGISKVRRRKAAKEGLRLQQSIGEKETLKCIQKMR